jgi:tRNA nucleotidyltransferase/poly(A) polymerase
VALPVQGQLPTKGLLMALPCRLHESGFMALIVGGWVRDRYLGRRASDIDIATNATPQQVCSLWQQQGSRACARGAGGRARVLGRASTSE